MSVELTSAQRRTLRARAHALNPVVSVAQHGLSPSVLKEIELSLKAHELIKIRVYGEDRDVREALLTQICEAVSAAPVQHIGNILVIYRAAPAEEAATTKTAKPAAKSSTRSPGKSSGKSSAKPARTAAGAKSTKSGARVQAGAGARTPRTTAAAPRRRAVTGKTRAGR